MNEMITLVAQNTGYVSVEISMFQMGMTVIGFAIMLAAIGVFLANPKDPEKAFSLTTLWIAYVIISSIGIGVTLFAWI